MARIGLYGQLVRKSAGDTIDADLLKGATGRIVVTSISFDTTTRMLSIGYLDESNAAQSSDIAVGQNNPTGAEVVALVDAALGSSAWQEALSNVDRHDLNAIPQLEAKTADLLVDVIARSWGTVTDVNLGAFASNNSGNLGPSHASALNYFISSTPTAADAANSYVYIRIPTNRDARDYRIRQNGSLGDFYISSWAHVGTHENFNYYRSRHNLFENYSVTIEYDAATAIQTRYRGKIDQSDWDETDSDENAFIQNSAEPKAQLADIPNLEQKTGDLIVHTVRNWANATDAQITAFSGRPASNDEPAGETYHDTLSQGAAEDYIAIRIPLANDLRDYRINQTNAGYEHNWQHLELLHTDATYRYGGTHVSVEHGSTLRPQYSAEQVHTEYRGETSPGWDDVDNRPNRPSAAELLAGTNTDEAVASVSDIASLVNTHRLQRSNAAPEDVVATAAEGTEAEVSRRDHGHRFPHDNTIAYDDANEQFGVNLHDVVEHLQESIRYYTDGINYANISNTGHSAGQIYATGPFPTTISHIQAQLGPLIGFPFFVATIYRVSSGRIIEAQLGRSHPFSPQSNNPHTWSFITDDNPVGVPIPTDSHIAILFHNSTSGVELEMRQGTEASDSPGKSYQDADNDFRMVNSAVYEHSTPSVGDDTEQHGDADDIRGNIKIFYVATYDHGNFIGNGNVNAAHIDSESATDGQVLTADGAGAAAWEDAPTGPGGGTGAVLSGNTTETLFDNRATTETALSVFAGAPDWGRTLDFGFSRALVEADDDKDLRIRFQITQGGQIRHFRYLVSADTFRLMPEYTAASGTVLPTTGHLIFTGADGRVSRNATSLFSRLNIGVRQRTTAGEDALRILLSISGNSHVAATNIRGIIELVPRVENLTIAGGTLQQQSGGAVLTRSTVADEVQQTTNAFEFDVRVGGTIGVGNYQINPIPVVDIFDLVASIRVDGRAAFPMRLSREQFDLVGESPEVVQTGAWPFAGTGGTTWGDVTEIPCAMMYIDHVTDGIVKNQINPQRQQIGWTIEGSIVATAILFFFDYDDAGNLTNVRVVAFSNSVVVIEGIHVHYWQEAT